MEYNYNNTMTISTSGPKNEMNARWALQNTLEGKALVYNECIKPLVGNRPLCEGVTLRLGDKPKQEADHAMKRCLCVKMSPWMKNRNGLGFLHTRES